LAHKKKQNVEKTSKITYPQAQELKIIKIYNILTEFKVPQCV